MPADVGIGLRSQHFDELLEAPVLSISWKCTQKTFCVRRRCLGKSIHKARSIGFVEGQTAFVSRRKVLTALARLPKFIDC